MKIDMDLFDHFGSTGLDEEGPFVLVCVGGFDGVVFVAVFIDRFF